MRQLPLLIKRVLSRFPTKLPVGASEFETWSDSIIELSGEYADIDSMKFAIASILIHADSKYGALPKRYFVDRLRKSAANQIASQVFQNIKQKQQKAAEVTAAQQQEQAALSSGEKTAELQKA